MKCILTVIGKDKPGIIAKVSNLLASHDVNIEDISQTVLQNNFTMIMLVNLEGSTAKITDLAPEAHTLGKEIGVEIYMQNEEVFNAMHKI